MATTTPTVENVQEGLENVKMEPSGRLHLTLGKIMHGKAVLHRLEDVRQVHRTEHQDSAPVKDEENEQFECIKEEQMEHFISVGKLHIEEQKHPLIKMEEDPPYVKEEGMDVPLWAVEPLSGSSSTEESQADNFMAPPSTSYDASSHLRIRWTTEFISWFRTYDLRQEIR
ncbi:uncharacterized protein LOC144085657 isoform X2 [Stigmatopora argus]